MVLTGIPWNGGDSPLDQEPDRHLCGGFFVLIADLPQGLVLQQTIAARSQRTPSLHDRVMGGQAVAQFLLLKKGVGLHLIYSGYDLTGADKVQIKAPVKIGYANGFYLALLMTSRMAR